MNRRLRKKKEKVLPEECWSLDITFAKYIVPRLKYFKNHLHGYPARFENEDEWKAILDKMIFAFEKVLEDDYLFCSDKDLSAMKEGLKLFAEYYMHLWD